MKSFTESDRYDYTLTPDSLVIDCGAYQGGFSRAIAERYKCTVLAFEPVFDIPPIPGVICFKCAVGGSFREDWFKIKGDSTGLMADAGETVKVSVMDIAAIVWPKIDLLKLNVESMEFEVLERVIEAGIQKRFFNIQVQFHPIVPDFESRYQAIRSKLLETHELTFDAPWCWQNFQLKA